MRIVTLLAIFGYTVYGTGVYVGIKLEPLKPMEKVVEDAMHQGFDGTVNILTSAREAEIDEERQVMIDLAIEGLTTARDSLDRAIKIGKLLIAWHEKEKQRKRCSCEPNAKEGFEFEMGAPEPGSYPPGQKIKEERNTEGPELQVDQEPMSDEDY